MFQRARRRRIRYNEEEVSRCYEAYSGRTAKHGTLYSGRSRSRKLGPRGTLFRWLNMIRGGGLTE